MREGTTCKVIRELEAQDIGQVEDGLVIRVIDLGSSDICLDAIDLFIRPLSTRGVSVLKCKTDTIRIWEFTLCCALIANACEGLRY